MARIFVADHPAGTYVQVQLNVESGSIIAVEEEVLKEVKDGGEYFQPYLDDLEWRFGNLLDDCFMGVDSLDAKARLQVVLGVLSKLNLEFQGD